MSIPVDPGELHGWLLLPADIGDTRQAGVAVALIVAGSGPTDRNDLIITLVTLAAITLILLSAAVCCP